MQESHYTLGIDVACRAAHVATLSDAAGVKVWTNHRFTTSTAQLEALWAKIPSGATVTVVVEPTRNAWVPVAAWLHGRGARVVLVPPEQSADLRRYYDKYTKNDRLDSVVLSRLPLLHPEGLTVVHDFGPAEPMRRAVRRRARFVEDRVRSLARLVALVELLGPGYADAFPHGFHSRTGLAVLARYSDPRDLKRLGHKRLTALLTTTSRGHLGSDKAAQLLAAAEEAIALYTTGGLDFAALGEDIAAEIRTVEGLNTEITRLDERIAAMLEAADPQAILASAPGIGPVLAPAILARIGDMNRFANQAAIRSFTGLVPSTSQSGKWAAPSTITKAGDPGLRHALFMAADFARQVDPTLAAKYRRLVLERGAHHNNAICHLAATLLTRIAACWRAGTHYQLRDLSGAPITKEQGRELCSQLRIQPHERARARATRSKNHADRATTEVA